MKWAAVALSSAFLFIPTDAPAKRVGLVRVFAATKTEIVEGRHRIVVKDVRDRRGRTIGEITQICTRVATRFQCIGTLDMPLGRLMFMGSRSSARYYVLAVVGGTGIYSGSSGQYAATTISTRGTRVEYVLVSLVP